MRAEETAVLESRLCTAESLRSPAFLAWAERLRPAWDPENANPDKPVLLHRKLWEWLFIAQALDERGMLAPGRRGLGFGVGQEPLVALFAAAGCRIVATDAPPDLARAQGWTETGVEYAGDAQRLNASGLCPPERFAERVTYRHVDMRRVPDDLTGFDFTWSSCAFEHLGSLSAGTDFVVAQLRALAPGGVSVHTTELNVSSDRDTVETGGTVLYRRRDLAALARNLRRMGYRIRLDLADGTTPEDRHVDVAPFTDVHLRTAIGDYVTTSVALVIENPVRQPLARRLLGAGRRPGRPAPRPPGTGRSGRSTPAR